MMIIDEISDSDACEYEVAVLWVILPCSLVVVHRPPDDGGGMHP
jgi:hypothetical protein